MAAPGGTTLPHRAVSSIRGGAAPPGDVTTTSTSSANPRTPTRSTMPSMSSQFNSPSSLRAEDEVLILELGARRLRAGFAGDAVPKALVAFCPAQARRVGDLRAWEVGHVDDWARGRKWGEEYELWRSDVRGLDLGLVGDRMERGLRDAFNKYLLIDSRPRRMVAVLPSGTPLPLLATALDTLFNRFHAPAVSLLSSPVACTISAGVRSALVVDLGWSETVVTGVYEYREVQSSRSVRAGKMLVHNTHKLLVSALGKAPPEEDGSEKETDHVVSFEECEEVVNRLVWCKHSRGPIPTSQPAQEGLPTVTEQDESESNNAPTGGSPPSTTVPLKSTNPPNRLDLTYDQLATPSEDTFFASEQPPHAFDDEELPIPLLIYRGLLKLPMDVRALCMARIIFTGGCSSVLGLRGRIFDEVSQLIEKHGWDPVRGKGVETFKSNPKLWRGSKQAGDGGPTDAEGNGDSGGGSGGGGGGGHEVDGMWVDAPKQEREPELDPIDDQLRKGGQEKPRLQGQLRAIECLGAWSGASLLNLLKIPALATVEREAWREHGIIGASRPTEVDPKVAQRQSMGAGGLMRNTNANWTLGVWGYL